MLIRNEATITARPNKEEALGWWMKSPCIPIQNKYSEKASFALSDIITHSDLIGDIQIYKLAQKRFLKDRGEEALKKLKIEPFGQLHKKRQFTQQNPKEHTFCFHKELFIFPKF